MPPPRINRRRFLGVSGLSVTVAKAAPAQKLEAPTGFIDCQSHLFSPEMIALMEKRATDPTVYTKDGTRFLKMGDWLRKVPPHYLDVDAKLATMDAAGIAMTALSINDPGPEWFGDDGVKVARMANDFVTGVVAKHPTRFFGLCVLPFQDMQATLAELDRCVNELGMKGVLLYTNLAGRFSDEPEFRPFFKRAVELNVPVLLHPAKAVTTDLVKGYEMTSTLGNMFDNTIALTRLLMSGILDEYPDLKLVCPHLGGTLPYIVGRLQHQVTVLKRGPQNLKRTPLDYLHRIWMDIVSPLPAAMKMCIDLVGPDRLLYASDHPWVQPELIRDDFRSLKLGTEVEEKLFFRNAKKLFEL